MAKRELDRPLSPRDVPPVGRPRGAVWRALQADGVVWEGQVSLVGNDADLAARMIVTHRRVVFVRGGDLVLDVPREWLRPEPVLRRNGVLDLFVAMPGGNLFDEPMTVSLRMREGHPAAGHIIAMLAPGGVRRILPESLSGIERAREAAPIPQFNGFWEVDDLDPSWTSGEPGSTGHGATTVTTSTANGVDGSAWLPIEPADRVVRISSTPTRPPGTNGYAITGLRPRDERKSSWGLILRAAALLALLATAAALGAGRLNLGGPGGDGSEAVLTGPPPTVAVVASPTAAPEAALAPDDQEALAIGVGGSATEASSADVAAEAAAIQAATATPPPTTAVIPTPAPSPASGAGAAASPGASTPDGAGATAERAATPAQSSPAAVEASQPGTAAPESTPAQELVAGPLRITVASAQRAETLPRYGLPPGSGEWVLLLIDVRNEGDDPATIPMSDFRLLERPLETTFELDSGTDVIAGLAGFDPPRSAADLIAVAPGESTEALLLYLLPSGSSEELTLIAGDATLDLAPVIAADDADA